MKTAELHLRRGNPVMGTLMIIYNILPSFPLLATIDSKKTPMKMIFRIMILDLVAKKEQLISYNVRCLSEHSIRKSLRVGIFLWDLKATNFMYILENNFINQKIGKISDTKYFLT